ncbi:MAG: 23S rRNA (adenine(2503)-C(2))-methyltransferase RlmN [Bacteroidales bacterium]|nr:23S rRNA (adenine(2503)-C(2))-methyltransferase RlmN [Bacteroidales bacterium]
MVFPKNNIYDLSLEDLKARTSTLKVPSFRSKQIWEGLYQHLYQDFSDFSNLPKALRSILDEQYTLGTIESIQSINSKDLRTTKTLFRLTDELLIEAVLMKYTQRRTICISTQVGCQVGCKFCATGQMGFTRNLTSGEIIEQVLHFQKALADQDDHLTNIVFMGMGEPFLNFDATMESIDSLNHPEGFNFGERRFTISSVGIPPAIIHFADMKRQINLAISLHAANDATRDQIIPINKKYPIKELIPVCKYYTRMTNRRITFEWALIDNLNDSRDHALELSQLLKGMLCHVNLIPLNTTSKFNRRGSNSNQVSTFESVLRENKIPVSVRVARGLEINAGCGQLAAKHQSDHMI